MKIILKETIKTKGRKYDVVDVADGYGMYLLRFGKAERATDGRIAEVEKLKADQAMKTEELMENAAAVSKDLDGKKFTVEVKASDKGHLYAAIQKKDVVDIIRDQAKVEIEDDHVVLSKAIKDLGEHTVTLRFSEDASAEITLELKAAEQTEEEKK